MFCDVTDLTCAYMYVCMCVCMYYLYKYAYMYVYMYATNIVCIFVSKGATPHCQYVLDKLQKDPNENQIPKPGEVSLGYKASFATNGYNRLLWPTCTECKAL